MYAEFEKMHQARRERLEAARREAAQLGTFFAVYSHGDGYDTRYTVHRTDEAPLNDFPSMKRVD